MSVLFRASAGFIARHPLQVSLAVVGIALGVAVMVSVDLAIESARAAFRMSVDTLNGRATHQVVGGPGGIDERVYVDLRVNHGDSRIAPVVTGTASINGERFQVIGTDVFAEAGFRTFYTSDRNAVDRIADEASSDIQRTVRALLTEPGSLLLSSRTAASLGLRDGDDVPVTVNGKAVTAHLAGRYGGGEAGPLDRIAVVDIAMAQEWFDMTGRLSRIDVVLADEAEGERLASLLPDHANLLPSETRTGTSEAMSQAFMTNLRAMSFLAMLVGIFLIYNSMAFSVLQRRSLFAVLRALGLTRAEVFRLVITESLVAGSMGAVLGVLFGLWLGNQLVGLIAQSISDHFFAVSVSSVSVHPYSIAKGLAAGLCATLFAAMVPALEAAAWPPRLAMSRSVTEVRSGARVVPLGIAGSVAAFGAAILLAFSGRSLLAGFVALFALIVGYVLWLPACVKFACNVLVQPVGRLFGTPARLAIAGVGATLSRTAVAVAALSVAVSATVGVSVMVDSFRRSVEAWLDTSLQSDIYVGVPAGSLDQELIAAVLDVPGIDNVSTTRRVWVEDERGRTRVIARDMVRSSYVSTEIRDSDSVLAWSEYDEGGVLVSDAFAYAHEASRGDFLELPTDRGRGRFKVAGIYRSYDTGGGAVMMSRETYDRWYDDPAVDSLGIYLTAGADPDGVTRAIRDVARGRQDVVISENSALRQNSLRIFDRTFVITDVLYWLAVIVAVIGILGAMLALQLERSREFGILRALGITPREIRRLVTTQSAFLGLVAGTAALPLGLVMAWVLIAVINRRAFGWQIDMVVSMPPLVFAVVLGLLASILAGIYPAYRAGRLRPSALLQFES